MRFAIDKKIKTFYLGLCQKRGETWE